MTITQTPGIERTAQLAARDRAWAQAASRLHETEQAQ